MKLLKLIILFIFTSMQMIYAQDIDQDIIDGFKLGKAELITIHLAEEVELILIEDQGLQSKDMTGIKLKNFLSEFAPDDFQIIHQGNSPSGTRYSIGEYKSGMNMFRIYMLFSWSDNAKIIEIRIEKDE